MIEQNAEMLPLHQKHILQVTHSNKPKRFDANLNLANSKKSEIDVAIESRVNYKEIFLKIKSINL